MTSINHAIINNLKARKIDPGNASLNVMLMYSGGADSISLAKSILESTQHKVVIHHVVIDNPEQRDGFQLDVLDAQLDYLKQNYRNFEFIKTSFGMNVSKGTGIRDMSLALFMAGTACRALNRRFSVIYTGHLLAAMADFIEAGSVLNSLFMNYRNKPIWLYPLRHINQTTSKEEIYKNIGPEVLNLSVSCRRPLFKDQTFVSCFTCPACKVRAKTVKSLGWDLSLVK